MSDIRKWLKIMESVEATLADQPQKTVIIKQDATVMVDPRIGGGSARYMHSTPQGAMVDIKGVATELAQDDFSLPVRDYQDPFENGNTWDHSTVEDDTVGTMNDKPEFRSGDMVKIEDVYGSVIGPGFGVFIAYSTSGQECIISFDNKQIVVPTANVGAVLEQNAKDNFDQVDNDGNLSPMSLGSDNVKVQKEPAMDHRDEFSKWMSAVEEALTNEAPLAEEKTNECGCGNWICESCFPNTDDHKDHNSEFADKIGAAKNDIEADDSTGFQESEDNMFDEEEEDFQQEEKPKSGRGVKMGDIVTKTEFRKTGGQESPLTYGEDNLEGDLDEEPEGADMEVEQPLFGEEDDFDVYGPGDNHSASAGFGSDDGGYGLDDFDDRGDEYDAGEDMEMGSPLNRRDLGREMSQIDPDEAMGLISAITSMQDSGFSNANKRYSEDELANVNPDRLREIHKEVTGDVSEEVKPTATKTHHPLDDLEDLFAPRQDQLPATMGGSDDEVDSGDSSPMSLPTASKSDTRNAMSGVGSMRDFIDRANPDVMAMAAGEPDMEPDTNVAVVSASEMPALISNELRTSGVVAPKWHQIRNLPGMNDRTVRAIGRGMMGTMTSTPVEDIRVIANLGGRGPNSAAEVNAVAAWLKNNAEDLGDVEVSHGAAAPGYSAQAHNFEKDGILFHIVKDHAGNYIYTWPAADSKQPGAGREQPGIGNGNNMPRLGESTKGTSMGLSLKPSLFEQLKWDEEITALLKESIFEEEEIDESSLSKLIGKQQGGQHLVQWLHRKHKLGNMADLQPQPFSERMLWKEFKRNPDNFVIVSATGGVAGIKPYEKMIKDRMEAARKKGRDYDPGGDATLQYQIIAFTDDGKQVDPSLLQPTPKDGEEREVDPTVMKARMGKINGRDMQNPDNVFNLLADQIGALRTVYLASGAVERDKMKGRADMKVTPKLNQMDAIKKVFKRVQPILKTLANQALGNIKRRIQRYNDGENYEAAQKLSGSAVKLKQFLATLDTSAEINLNDTYGHNMKSFTDQITNAIVKASGSYKGSEEFNEFLEKAANGSAIELKPVLDALRDNLVSL